VVVGRATGLRVGDIAARIGISLPSASRLIARLEERGYVVTARDERDRRGTLVTMTPTGVQVREAVIARRAALIAAALGDDGPTLPPDLGRGLGALARALERYS
jgi:DNA-binding MarR family transcriptional regulator